MKSTLRILLIGSAALASAGLASASLTEDHSVSFNSLTGSKVNYNSLSFPKFNIPGATLTGVSLNWDIYSGITSDSVKNDSGGSVTLSEMDFTRTFTAKIGSSSGATLLSNTTAITPQYFTATLADGETVSGAPVTFAEYLSGFQAVAGSLAAYQGAGSGTMFLQNSFGLNALGAALDDQDLSWTVKTSGSANGSVVVRYTYLTPVPEPGSLLALGCLVGSGAFLRTRRRHA